MKKDNGKLSVVTGSPDQTRRLGMHIGRLAEGNQIYLLTGNLGTGKTHHLEEIAGLGLDEYFREDSVCAIEWADKGAHVLPGDNLTIRLTHLPGEKRNISFIPHGKRYNELVNRLKDSLQNDREDKWSWQ
jgi:tRNA threonylcarbamoyladenosine biosynthesis protein TsaE